MVTNKYTFCFWGEVGSWEEEGREVWVFFVERTIYELLAGWLFVCHVLFWVLFFFLARVCVCVFGGVYYSLGSVHLIITFIVIIVVAVMRCGQFGFNFQWILKNITLIPSV